MLSKRAHFDLHCFSSLQRVTFYTPSYYSNSSLGKFIQPVPSYYRRMPVYYRNLTHYQRYIAAFQSYCKWDHRWTKNCHKWIPYLLFLVIFREDILFLLSNLSYSVRKKLSIFYQWLLDIRFIYSRFMIL
jgi:hypothetical protein